MTVYGVAHLTVTDRISYDRYTAKFMPILQQHNGRLLVADDDPRLIEDSWQSEKLVILSFDDTKSFDQWYNSPEYQAILSDRLAGAQGPLLLARGIPQRS